MEQSKRDKAMVKVAAGLNKMFDSGTMTDNLDGDVQEMLETTRFASLLEISAEIQALERIGGGNAAKLLASLNPIAADSLLKWLFSFAIFAVWERARKLGLDDALKYGLTDQCKQEQLAIARKNMQKEPDENA